MVTNNFASSSLDLNGLVTLSQPTALDWGPDGRLYVTEVSGSVKVLTVDFGDPTPDDGDATSVFYVTAAETLDHVKTIPNFNDDGTPAAGLERQVTGITAVQQFDGAGNALSIDGKPAVSVYVTSSDSRIGAGGDGSDIGLDTNSGIITRIDQTATGWTAIDLVRGLARSEENHSLNGLEIIQSVDVGGLLTRERMIVANGGNTNCGAPSNNFAGQQETAYSGAILEVDLDQLKTMPVQVDGNSGRAYIYDIPTLNDPTRVGNPDSNDPFGGNDAFNGGKLVANGPVRLYSPGYRNAYDVKVTEDGRVWTYDNGANNSWGGRPIGEPGDDGGSVDNPLPTGYIATNLNNGDGNSGDTINLESWNPKNFDHLHEITRSDDLAGRSLSAGQGGATTYQWQDPQTSQLLTLVYGGHPNPTRASGARSGILYTPKNGVEDAFLLVSDVEESGPGSSDFDAVTAFLADVEADYASVGPGDLTSRVIGVTPGELYFITQAGGAFPVSGGSPSGETVLGQCGLPADIDDVVAELVPVEGNYLEGGYTDGAVDAGKGSINGLAEYTSTLLDDTGSGVKMSGALFAASLNQGTLIVIGRDADGIVQTTPGTSGQTLAADRTTLSAGGAPLGLAAIGDDISAFGGQTAFQGSVWAAIFKQNGPFIEIYQPNNGTVPLAGSEVTDPTDQDLDGIDYLHDPFEFSAENGFPIEAGGQILLEFDPTQSPYPGTILDTGLMGAALDGVTPNQDARTAEEGFAPDQQRDGLYDLGGNVIPGGNAPIFQIKKVAGGTVVGSANTARDAMHVGVRPGVSVQTLVATTRVKNWIPSVVGGLKTGQLTGLMFGDGTQFNFLRLMFGAVPDGGSTSAGFEVGVEIGDTNYTPLAQVAVPALADVAVTTLDLRLEIDIAASFAVKAAYKLSNAADFVELDLGGYGLPSGVLQDVLTGAHTISDGATTLPSGAAFGFLAETTPADAAIADGLSAIDFHFLEIEALGDPNAVETVVYRVNAGGGTIAAIDSGPDWLGDTDPGFPYLFGNTADTFSGSATNQESEIDLSHLPGAPVPWQLFASERYDGSAAAPKLEYGFPVTAGKTYRVTLYYTENWDGIFGYSGDRLFDVEVEGSVPTVFAGINPLQEASDLLGPGASQDALLGVALSRSHTLIAADSTLNLAFNHIDENPKVNAIEIVEIGPPPDSEAPVVESITVETPTDNDSPIHATVVVTDNLGVDLASITGDELIFTGIAPATASLASGGGAIVTSNGGKSVAITYQLTPPAATNAWPSGTFTIGVAADSYLDNAGNGVAAFEAPFSLAVTTGGLFSLDFATDGTPLVEGGFDDTLGGIVDGTKAATVTGGALVIDTSDGDISKGQSANDFIKHADLSDPALSTIRIATRIPNPFPAALTAQGLTAGTVPNYAQQGILFGLGTQGKNELVKLVFGGNNGNAVQLWSNPDGGGIDTIYPLDTLFSSAGLGLNDVAAVEMALVIDKASGVVTPEVTLLDGSDAVIGGLRATTTPGFVTASAESLPAAVLANLNDPGAATAIGVTACDYKAMASFEARWEYLDVTSG
ncbi:Di-glucose binding within endoplasmic reticulum [Modicisalibacter ilicicola DSM 19980]|uniref:Di-glucose binding within endoplasmic reticulum n=1 Tax=Modicisalibacter ilicicola DSM 19980 TaxID=1121942 RepID=A0A1M4T0X4_9GAMM|nr:malectin domain-containing carbohydrate-binding protein [Halomonas ilicicola]SHE38142.1 Di-glucose binding within endoplasmic reticulum [Halomonas ilicicola DSM 19980]